MSRVFLPWGFSLLVHAVALLLLGWVAMAPVLPYVQEGVEVELVSFLPGGDGASTMGEEEQSYPRAGGERGASGPSEPSSQEDPDPSGGPGKEDLRAIPTEAPVVAQPSPPQPSTPSAESSGLKVKQQRPVAAAPSLLARAMPTWVPPAPPRRSEISGGGTPGVGPVAPIERQGAKASPDGSKGQASENEGSISAVPSPGEGGGRGSGGTRIATRGGGTGEGIRGRGVNWRRLLRQRIERAKRYPVLARRLGMEGTVHVEFRIAHDGSVEGVKVAKSSGYPLLDEASVEAIKRAAPLPMISGKIRVPISYRLRKGR